MKNKDGDEICSYCYKKLIKGNITEDTLSRRNRGRIETFKNKYCADTKCATKDQMAHEG